MADDLLPHWHKWASDGKWALVRNADSLTEKAGKSGCYYNYGIYTQFPDAIPHYISAATIAALSAGITTGICHFLKIPPKKNKVISSFVAGSAAFLTLYFNPYIWRIDCTLH